jgi:hypothetical protein
LLYQKVIFSSNFASRHYTTSKGFTVDFLSVQSDNPTSAHTPQREHKFSQQTHTENPAKTQARKRSGGKKKPGVMPMLKV